MTELGLGTVMRLVTVPQISVLVVNNDTFYAVSAWMDADIAFTCAASTIRYHVQLIKEGYGLPEAFNTLWISSQSFCSHRILMKMSSLH